MKSNELRWALFTFFFILLAYLLPYTLFTNVTKWYGSFLLWSSLTLIVFIINYFFTKDWGK